MSSGVLLECGGCWENVPMLAPRSFRDGWDSGENIFGEFCRQCCENIFSGHPLPNMRAGYRRP